MTGTSKKHYVAVAGIIHDGLPDAESGKVSAQGALYDVAFRLAELFTDDNPQFDRHRFLVACGVKS